MAHLTIQNQLITKNVYKTIIHTCGTPELEKYLKTRNVWNTSTLGLIWWEPLYKTLLSLPTLHQIFASKLIHQRLPCKGEKFTNYADELCPLCKEK